MNQPSSPATDSQRALDTEPQSIDAPITAAAAFLVLTVKDDSASVGTAQPVLASTDDLVKDVRIRAHGGLFTCNVGISHRAWGPLTAKPPPKELAPFKEVRGARHTAVSTAGDLLYHIRAESSTEGQKSHKTLCTIEDADGEHDILRDNMPFASPGRNEYGTYFIGYSRHFWVIEKMLERMFIGDPPPLHDRILDFSKAVTGVTFFAPARAFLGNLAP